MVIHILIPALSLSTAFLMSFLEPSKGPRHLYFVAISAITFVLLPLLTLLLYRRKMGQRLRKYGGNLVERDYPQVHELIKKLCGRMNVEPPTSLYVRSEELDAIVFGSVNKKYILLTTGLCKTYHTFPSIVETILTHELAHLKNGDVVKHQVAESLSMSFAIVAILGSVCSILLFTPWVISGFLIVMLVYLILSAVLFYFNSLFKRWREIYADLRAISVEGSSKPLLTSLRLLYPVSKPSIFRRILSPFTLTVRDRIKILQDDVFKQVVGRIAVCGAVSSISVYLSFLSTIFVWPLIADLTVKLLTPLLTIIPFSLFLVVAPPYWVYSMKDVKTRSEHLYRTFVTPGKVWLAVIPFLLFAYWWSSYLLFLLVLISYMVLFLHQLFFNFILCLVSLNIPAKHKVLLSESILIILPLFFILHYLNLTNQIVLASAIIGTIIISVTLILWLKYGKCPNCKAEIELHTPFRCPRCLCKLNEDFLVLIE